MEVNKQVHGGHGRPLSRQISQARYIQQQRELRLNSTYKNFRQRSLDQGHSRQCSYILPNKADIFMKAGRLAAEYLVSKGLLSPSLLPSSQANADQERFKGKDGDFLEPRTSTPAETRKGAPGVDQSDENDSDLLATRYLTNKKRRELDSRRFGLDQRRDAGRRGPSVETTARNPYTGDRDEDFPPGFGMSWRRGLAEAGENVSRIFRDDKITRGNGKGEHKSETGNYRTKDVAILKAGSGRSGKEHPQEANQNLNKVGDNGSSVLVDILRGNMSSALEKKNARMDDRQERTHEQSLLKLTSFAEVPKKPHLLLAHQNFALVDQRPIAEVKTTSKVDLKGVSMFVHHDKKTDERCSRRDHISGPRPEKENCGTTDDTKIKACFSRSRKAHKSELNLDVGKLDDDGKVLDLLKTDSSGHSKEQDVLLEDKTIMQHDNDLLKLISYPKVQKKPRSLLAKRNRQTDLVGQGHTEAKRALEVDAEEAYKVPMENGSNLGLVCVIDNASLPIKKRGIASLIQPNSKMVEQHPCRTNHLRKATMEFNDGIDDGRQMMKWLAVEQKKSEGASLIPNMKAEYSVK